MAHHFTQSKSQSPSTAPKALCGLTLFHPLTSLSPPRLLFHYPLTFQPYWTLSSSSKMPKTPLSQGLEVAVSSVWNAFPLDLMHGFTFFSVFFKCHPSAGFPDHTMWNYTSPQHVTITPTIFLSLTLSPIKILYHLLIYLICCFFLHTEMLVPLSKNLFCFVH